MQPDNERIIDLVAQAENYMRELIVAVINAGATAPTINALSEALNAINYSYSRDGDRVCARAGILAPAVDVQSATVGLSSSELKTPHG